jgi:hypothetical protein
MALLPAALTNIFKWTVFPKMFRRLTVETPLIFTGFSTPRFWREIYLSNEPDRTFCFVLRFPTSIVFFGWSGCYKPVAGSQFLGGTAERM